MTLAIKKLEHAIAKPILMEKNVTNVFMVMEVFPSAHQSTYLLTNLIQKIMNVSMDYTISPSVILVRTMSFFH